MKTLMNYKAIILLMITFLGASSLNAQEWTKEQKAVWQEVENMWAYWQAGDFDSAFANVHENYLGWNNESPMPISKKKWIDPMKKSKELYSDYAFDIEPARILVHGDAAVVHYYYQMSWRFNDGEEKYKASYHGKWTAFFIKEDGKWMMLGDMTFGETDE
ncbi:MAG: nuclear transport factor 2 family protein [Bacteroidota bacterium]